jgi:hypothetical protein
MNEELSEILAEHKNEEFKITTSQDVLISNLQKIEMLEKEIVRIIMIVSEHNKICVDLCNDRKDCGYAIYKRDCPNCHKDNMIDMQTNGRNKPTNGNKSE